jgi:hypothetical protein
VGIVGAYGVVIGKANVASKAVNNAPGGAAAGIVAFNAGIEIQDGAEVDSIGDGKEQSAGILVHGSGVVNINSGAKIRAEGIGANGNGIAVDGSAGRIDILDDSTVTAIAHGEGFSFYIYNGDLYNNSLKTTAYADNGHYYKITYNGNFIEDKAITFKPNTAMPGGHRRHHGGCDAGFGFGGLFLAAGAALICRGKR